MDRYNTHRIMTVGKNKENESKQVNWTESSMTSSSEEPSTNVDKGRTMTSTRTIQRKRNAKRVRQRWIHRKTRIQ